MIQIVEIYPASGGRCARLNCTCGHGSLAQCNCTQGEIIYCTHCGQLATPDQLRASLPGGAASDLGFEPLPTGHACPLISVSITVSCAWTGVSEAQAGMITKFSPEKLIIRLLDNMSPGETGQRAGSSWNLNCTGPDLAGAFSARLTQVLKPQSATGITYYELAIDPQAEPMRELLTHFYHRQCSRSERTIETSAELDSQTCSALLEQATRLTTEAISRLYDTNPTLIRGAQPFSVDAEEFVRVLCMASESHDSNSSNHLKRIAAYSAAVAHEMGWTQRRVAMIATASKLHDVGKLGVPDAILKKPGALTLEERRVMQQHTRFGWQILNDSGSEVIRLAALIALRHHERFDGAGYPDGLAAELIPIEAQIVSLVDVFDALTTARAYKPAWSNDQARSYIREQSGKMFHQPLVAAFERVWPEIEKNQLRFLDDFRDIWTERRKAVRNQTDPLPLQMEIAIPEQTFRPLRLNAMLLNLSPHGLKLRVQGVSNDLFSTFVASRRYAKITFPALLGGETDGSFCSVVWMDYYAIPDPEACLMGLEFQKVSADHTALFNDLRNSVGLLV